MTFTNEMIAKAKTAASAEELLEMAKAEGNELTEEERSLVTGGLPGTRIRPFCPEDGATVK